MTTKPGPLFAMLTYAALLTACSGDDGGGPPPITPASAAESTSLLTTVAQRGVLRVGTTGTYFPFSQIAADGSFEGYDIDVAKKIGEDLGVRVEFVQAPWPTIVAGLAAGKYDIAASGISLTLDRMKSVAFTDSYVRPSVVPLIRKQDEGKYKTWRDLDSPDVTIAVMLGTSAERMTRTTFTKANIISVEAPALDWQEVLSGHAHAAINDNLTYARVERHNSALVVLDPEHPLKSDFNGMITKQGDQVWLNWLNAWIMLRKDNGFFEELDKKWILGEGG
jgi:cyclohexadienyl dehydratase